MRRFDRRKWAVAAALLVSTGALAAPELPDSAGKIALAIGGQKVLTAPGLERVAVGDPGIADVRSVGGGQVLIVGRTEGRTTMTLWHQGGERSIYAVLVRARDPAEVMDELRRGLGERSKVRARQTSEGIALEGEVDTLEEKVKVGKLLNANPTVIDAVRVPEPVRQASADALAAALLKAELGEVRVNRIGDVVMLEGAVEASQDLQKVDLVVKAVGERIASHLTVGVQRMVLAEVQFLEVRRSAEDRTGVRLPLDISGTVPASADLSFAGGTLEQSAKVAPTASAQFALQAMINDGNARLLAQPRLVCVSGEKADFLAGGEVPIPLVSSTSFAIEYKRFGVQLTFKPVADRLGNIQAEIEAESSDVDRSVSVGSGGTVAAPGFRTRRVKTTVSVRHGETIVLSGLYEHDEQKGVSKVPLLGSIPLIGELFKTRSVAAAKRELIVFVTPRVVSAGSARVKAMIEESKERYREAKDDVGYRLID